MSYSRHAYTDLSKILAGQVEEILESAMSENDMEVSIEAVQIVGERIADLFERNNPHGFDRDRFMIDSKLETAEQKEL